VRRAAPELPTLDEALAFFARESVGVHVDVKARGGGPGIAAALREHELAPRAVVSSFWPDVLRDVRAAAPAALLHGGGG
jgi:hypothetical protein